MDALDPNDVRPAYQQVADRIRAAIREGGLAPGEQLPTQKALSEMFAVAMETAKRALNELKVEGLIVTRQGKGSYVRATSANAPDGSSHASEVPAWLADVRRDLDEVKRRLTVLEDKVGP